MLLHFANIPCIRPYPMVSRLHGLLPLFAAILYQRILPFSFQVGSLPFSTQLPLIPHVPSSQCVLRCSGSHSVFSLPCLDEVLQLSIHPFQSTIAAVRFTVCFAIRFARPLRGPLLPPSFPRTDFMNRYITVPRCRLPSLGVLQRHPPTTRVLAIL